MATDACNEGWKTATGIMLPRRLLENLRKASSSDKEFERRVKEVKESEIGRMGGFSEVKIKYRVTMPDKKEVTNG